MNAETPRRGDKREEKRQNLCRHCGFSRAAESSLDQQSFRFGQCSREFNRGGVSAVGHLSPGFLENVDHFLILMPTGEINVVELAENQARDVFESLGVGVGLE